MKTEYLMVVNAHRTVARRLLYRALLILALVPGSFFAVKVAFYLSNRIANIQLSAAELLVIGLFAIGSLLYFIICVSKPMLGLAILIFLLPAQWVGPDVGFQIDPADVAVIVVWSSVLGREFLKRDKRSSYTLTWRLFGPLGLYLVFVFLSTLVHRDANFGNLARHLLAVSFVLLSPKLIKDNAELQQAISWFRWTGLSVAMLALFAYSQGAYSGEITVGNQQFARAGSFILQGNALAVFLVASTIIAYGRYVETHTRSDLLSFSICLVALFLTFSRGPWLGFVVGMLVLIVVTKPDRSALLPLWLIVLITLVLPSVRTEIWLRMRSILYDYLGISGRYSVLNRLASWRHAVGLIADHPMLGIGYGNLPKYNIVPVGRAGVFRYLPMHNGYLQVATELGIPALISMLSFLMTLLKSLWTHASRLPEENQSLANCSAGILSALVGVLIVNLFHDFLVIPLFFWWLISVGITIETISSKSET